MLGRLKELAVQAANDTNTDADRLNIQDEVECILEEIDRIGDETESNTFPDFVYRDKFPECLFAGRAVYLGQQREPVGLKGVAE